MNILILNQYALPRGSAGITRHGDLGSVLVHRGHQVTIIASGFDYLTRDVERTGSQAITKENHDGVGFIWLKTTTYKANDGKRIKSMIEYSLKSIFASIRSLSKKPDIVIASSPQLLAGLSGFLVAKYYRVPFALEIRDVWPDALVELGGLRASSFAYKALRMLESFLYNRAELVISVLPYFHERLQELSIDSHKSVYIPNGIFTCPADENKQFDASQLTSQKLLNILNSSKGKKIILYTGSLGVAQDLSVVIEAFSYLREYHPDYYSQLILLMIGDGSKKEALERDVEKSGHLGTIFFHDVVSKQCIQILLPKADLLLLPLADISVFKYGLSANKMFDYLDAEKPILIISSIHENPILQARAGFTAPSSQPEIIAKAILNFLDSPNEDLIEMGQRGKQYVREHHDLSVLGEKLEEALLKVVNNSSI
jgi:glycosyltransferase involved in cell wall biosynthesis